MWEIRRWEVQQLLHPHCTEGSKFSTVTPLFLPLTNQGGFIPAPEPPLILLMLLRSPGPVLAERNLRQIPH